MTASLQTGFAATGATRRPSQPPQALATVTPLPGLNPIRDLAAPETPSRPSASTPVIAPTVSKDRSFTVRASKSGEETEVYNNKNKRIAIIPSAHLQNVEQTRQNVAEAFASVSAELQVSPETTRPNKRAAVNREVGRKLNVLVAGG